MIGGQKDKNRNRLIAKHLKNSSPPKGVLNEVSRKTEIEDTVGQRVKILVLNIGSFGAKKAALECCIHDHAINKVISTESSVTTQKVDSVDFPNFKCANHCSRDKINVKGGGGGGVLIFVHNAIPCVPGCNMMRSEENETEHCSTSIYPPYNYNLPLNIVCIYGPPE